MSISYPSPGPPNKRALAVHKLFIHTRYSKRNNTILKRYLKLILFTHTKNGNAKHHYLICVHEGTHINYLFGSMLSGLTLGGDDSRREPFALSLSVQN